jgi:acyl carrier protein
MRSAPAEISDPATKMLDIVAGLVREIDPLHKPETVTLDSRLGRDLGIDSLGRAELVFRIERAFGVSLPERVLVEAETPRDLLVAALSRPGMAEIQADIIRPTAKALITSAEPLALPTLCAVLDWHAAQHPERPHLVLEDPGKAALTISYGALAEKARRAARGLRELSVAPRDRVAIMLPTSEAFFVAFFAVLYAGAIPVPIYPPARPSEIEEHLRRQAAILDNAGATMLIAPPALRTPALLLRSLVADLTRVVDVESLTGGGDAPLPNIDESAATALLQYTSGSTGMPKGVILSHANLLANIRAMGAAIKASAADVFVSWLPLYHDMGLIGVWLGSLYFGALFVVLPPQSFLLRPERWLWAIHRHRGTLSAAPNFAFALCTRRIADSAIAGLDLSSLRLVANGSEAVDAETIRRFQERFGRYGFRPEAMVPAYGLAESAVALALPPLGRPPLIDRIDRQKLARSGRAEPVGDPAHGIAFVGCGRPLPGHEIRLVDETGRELGERHEGRLQFRGPSATSGYFRNPARTRELFSGDWLESGDLAYIADGEIFITGRSKDLIIRAGRHIHPAEIEAAVGEVPGVRQDGVAAFGSHDPVSGTERLVILAETTVPPERQEALRGHIAAAVIGALDRPPEEIMLVASHSIPKTPSGKLRRAAACALYQSGTLGRARRSLRWQILGLAGAALLPQARHLLRMIAAILYAVYWWVVIAVLAPPAWLLTVLLPKRAWRWACLRAIARAALRLTGIAIAVDRQAELPSRAIIVSNHASYIDSLALAAALPGEPGFIAKSELFHRPLARLPLQALGTLFVARDDAEQGIEDARHAVAIARRGGRLVFFPEGTLTRAPGLMPFRLGAFAVAAAADLPVVPVALRGTRSILRGGQWFPRHGNVRVRIGKPVMPEGAAFADIVHLRDRTRAVVLDLCGEPDLAMG